MSQLVPVKSFPLNPFAYHHPRDKASLQLLCEVLQTELTKEGLPIPPPNMLKEIAVRWFELSIALTAAEPDRMKAFLKELLVLACNPHKSTLQ